MWVEEPFVPPPGWLRGNTHSHTLNSDGDSPPADVVRWYRDAGYHFLVLSDHNGLTDVSELNSTYGGAGEFVLIRGEEVSNLVGGRPLDVTAVGTGSRIGRQFSDRPVDALQRSIDAIHRDGGLAIVNHPNFYFAISAADIEALRDVRHFELFNGTPNARNSGGDGVPSTESVWDRLLTGGHLIFGVAADDAHILRRPPSSDWAGPGKGWVMVRGTVVREDSILAALDRGDFYASTGVYLTEYTVTDSSMSLSVLPSNGLNVTIEFIGRGGSVLQMNGTTSASYTFAGDEGYVRARAIRSDGRMAWMQPVFIPQR